MEMQQHHPMKHVAAASWAASQACGRVRLQQLYEAHDAFASGPSYQTILDKANTETASATTPLTRSTGAKHHCTPAAACMPLSCVKSDAVPAVMLYETI